MQGVLLLAQVFYHAGGGEASVQHRGWEGHGAKLPTVDPSSVAGDNSTGTGIHS